MLVFSSICAITKAGVSFVYSVSRYFADIFVFKDDQDVQNGNLSKAFISWWVEAKHQRVIVS